MFHEIDITNTNQLLSQIQISVSAALPILNRDVDSSRLALSDFLNWVAPFVSSLQTWYATTATEITRDEAREAIKILSFLSGSIEKQFQAVGNLPGKGIESMPGLEQLLLDLSPTAQHPPLGTHYTYWLWNKGNHVLNFIGDSGEALFREVVNAQAELQTVAVNLIRPICQETCALHSSEAANAIALAAQNTEHVRQYYLRFTEKDALTGERRLTVESFTFDMRNALVSYPINGKQYGGINADNLISPMQLDFLLGTVDDKYPERIQKRRPYLIPEDIAALDADRQLPSLTGLCLESLRWTERKLVEENEFVLANDLLAQYQFNLSTFAAYSRLFKAVARLTALHWAFIDYYLIRYRDHIDREPNRKLVKQPNQSTGDNPLDLVKGIMEMRRKHPIISRLVGVIDLALSKPPVAS